MLQVLTEEDGDTRFRPFEREQLEDVVEAGDDLPLLWIDVAQPETDEVLALAEAFRWRPTLTEDVKTGDQRQKYEEYQDHLLLVVYRPRFVGHRAGFDEFYIVAGGHWIVTLHTAEPGDLDALGAAALRAGELERNGAMNAVVTFADSIVDAYEHIVSRIATAVDEVEASAFRGADALEIEDLVGAATLRLNVTKLLRAAERAEPVVRRLKAREKRDVEHSDDLDLRLRDIHDHLLATHADLEDAHDTLMMLSDFRSALFAFRQNATTEKLTAWGALLLVPTVVTGWFGMNFKHLEGLGEREGPWLTLGAILLVCGLLALLFRRRGYI